MFHSGLCELIFFFLCEKYSRVLDFIYHVNITLTAASDFFYINKNFNI